MKQEITIIDSQPDDKTYYTGGSCGQTRVAAAVVHMVEEILIRLTDSESVLDAEMTAIRVALEDASETRDNLKIHTLFDSCKHTKQ